jgi:hypothetical protein
MRFEQTAAGERRCSADRKCRMLNVFSATPADPLDRSSPHRSVCRSAQRAGGQRSEANSIEVEEVGRCRTTSATAIPSTLPITPGLPGIGSKGCGSSLRPKPHSRLLSPMLSPHARGWRARHRDMHCHPSVAHNQILNGASVISSPLISPVRPGEIKTRSRVLPDFLPALCPSKCRCRPSVVM